MSECLAVSELVSSIHSPSRSPTHPLAHSLTRSLAQLMTVLERGIRSKGCGPPACEATSSCYSAPTNKPWSFSVFNNRLIITYFGCSCLFVACFVACLLLVCFGSFFCCLFGARLALIWRLYVACMLLAFCLFVCLLGAFADELLVVISR